MKTKNILYWFLPFLTSLLILSGCASDKNTLEELKKSVQLTLKFETGMETNLNKKGAANPIMIRVYELKNPSTFEQLDYFSLQDKDRVYDDFSLITQNIVALGSSISGADLTDIKSWTPEDYVDQEINGK